MVEKLGSGADVNTTGDSSSGDTPTNMNRRKFLATALGATGLFVSGCASTESLLSSAAGPTTSIRGFELAPIASDRTELVALYSPSRVIAANQPGQRVPFGVVEPGESTLLDQSSLPVTIRKDGEVYSELTVEAHVAAHDHVGNEPGDGHQHADISRYFPLRVEFPEPGIYDLETVVNGQLVTLPVQAFDNSEVQGILPGQQFLSVQTPTDDDPAGVDRVCTRFEHCGLHSVSVDEILGREAFVLLVATPAFCATAFCGPVIETVLGITDEFPSVQFIHGEVYSNTEEVNGNFADPNIEIADYLVELGLDFEPVLYVVNANGTLVERLDNIFDVSELRAAVSAAV